MPPIDCPSRIFPRLYFQTLQSAHLSQDCGEVPVCRLHAQAKRKLLDVIPQARALCHHLEDIACSARGSRAIICRFVSEYSVAEKVRFEYFRESSTRKAAGGEMSLGLPCRCCLTSILLRDKLQDVERDVLNGAHVKVLSRWCWLKGKLPPSPHGRLRRPSIN